tara:strand:+ start:3336 stop:3563 length:228 start_codon:yes stop_codon:yes gene_type:complete
MLIAFWICGSRIPVSITSLPYKLGEIMIHVTDIEKWLDLLKESKDELLKIYGERAIKGIPLYHKLVREIEKSKEK